MNQTQLPRQIGTIVQPDVGYEAARPIRAPERLPVKFVFGKGREDVNAQSDVFIALGYGSIRAIKG